MMKFEQLEALVADLGLKQSELENWLLFRHKREEGGHLLSPLPIVYYNDDELYLSLEFDSKNEDRIFGWLLDGGLIMCRPNLLDESVWADYESVCSYAMGRFYDNYRTLPASITQVKHVWKLGQKLKVKATMDMLEANGVDCGSLQGVRCWCADDVSAAKGQLVSLTDDADCAANEQNAAVVVMLTV